MNMPKYIKWLFVGGWLLLILGLIMVETEMTQTGVTILSMISVGMWIIDSINATKDNQEG